MGTTSMNQSATEVYTSVYHQTRFAFDPERAKVWRALCRYLQPWVDLQAGSLDLGAGYGDFSRFIQSGPKWALDLNPDLIPHWAEGVRPLIQGALSPLPIEAHSGFCQSQPFSCSRYWVFGTI